MNILDHIKVRVNFSKESPSRPGWLTIIERGDTLVFYQSLERSEQWEDDTMQAVYIPRGLLEALFTSPWKENLQAQLDAVDEALHWQGTGFGRVGMIHKLQGKADPVVLTPELYDAFKQQAQEAVDSGAAEQAKQADIYPPGYPEGGGPNSLSQEVRDYLDEFRKRRR